MGYLLVTSPIAGAIFVPIACAISVLVIIGLLVCFDYCFDYCWNSADAEIDINRPAAELETARAVTIDINRSATEIEIARAVTAEQRRQQATPNPANNEPRGRKEEILYSTIRF